LEPLDDTAPCAKPAAVPEVVKVANAALQALLAFSQSAKAHILQEGIERLWVHEAVDACEVLAAKPGSKRLKVRAPSVSVVLYSALCTVMEKAEMRYKETGFTSGIFGQMYSVTSCASLAQDYLFHDLDKLKLRLLLGTECLRGLCACAPDQ
jgi:hypothetical protein